MGFISFISRLIVTLHKIFVMANIKIIKGQFEKGACAAGKAEVFANAIKHDHRSKNPTTRWSDIIELK